MSVAQQVEPTRSPREYETIYILAPNVSPEDAEKVASRVREVMEKMKGTLTRVDLWGKRRLAYPIGKHSRGIFLYLRYVAYSDLIAELERNLRMLDPVMRYQTVLIRSAVELEKVVVDPAEVEFTAIEVTEDEDEPGIEERLGLVERSSSRSHDTEEEYSDDDDDDDVVVKRGGAATAAKTGDAAAAAKAPAPAEASAATEKATTEKVETAEVETEKVETEKVETEKEEAQ